jgi:hypothetical protein
MWQRYGVWGLSPEGGRVKLATQAFTEGGGAGSHILPIHVIGKRMVNTTLTKGHYNQTRRTASIFNFFHMIAVHQIKLYIIIFDWGRRIGKKTETNKSFLLSL